MNKIIQDLREKQEQLSWQTYWLKNYYKPYLKSEYASKIFRHKNAISCNNEILVKILNPVEDTTLYVLDNKQEQININWQDFFSGLLKKILNILR